MGDNAGSLKVRVHITNAHVFIFKTPFFDYTCLHLALQEVIERLREATESLKVRRTLRVANLTPTRPTEDALKKLDSSMKKNTTLIRKLKQLTEDNSKSILDDIAKTNQSKYVSEAVAAVVEAPLKLRDIAAAVRICSALHQRYAEVSVELVPALTRLFTVASTPEEEKPSIARKRAALRLLVELLLNGVITSHSGLLSVVKHLSATADFTRDREEALACLSLMTVFAKVGREEILGLPHAEPAALPADLASRAASGEQPAAECSAAAEEYAAELAQRWSLELSHQTHFRSAGERLLDAAIAILKTSHESLLRRERDNERILNSRGDLPESLSAKYEAQRTAFEALQRSTASLAEVLEKSLPELKTTSLREDENLGDGGDAAGGAAGSTGASQSPYEDEETRAFYEFLPNLRSMVPAVLLKGAAEPAADGTAGGVEDALGEDGASEIEAALAQLQIGGGDGAKQESTVVGEQVSGVDGEGAAENADDDDVHVEGAPEEDDDKNIEDDGNEAAEEEEEDDEDEKEEAGEVRGAALTAVLERLPQCVSKDLCDEVAVEFCFAGGAGKGARKRMARTLTRVPLGALQVLPYYARVAAVLAPLFPDIPAALVKSLEGECRGLSRKKDATFRTLEPRLRNARYIAELLKFRLFPAGTSFLLLKSLLDDFSGHNVEAACALVEGAGRYLLRRPDTTVRMTNMLEIMMKLKNAKNMDARLGGLIDSTYYIVKSTAQGPRVKERPPIHEWIRYLIYSRLETSSVPFVLKKLRRLHWKEDGEYVLRTLLRAARKGRFSQVAPIASVAAGLAKAHPSLGVGMVDAVVEEITAGMENPEAALYQRRVAAVRLLGELYAYRLATSALIFSTLMSLLSYGHAADVPAEVTRRLDPPHNFFRVRLVCALLESCGTYFAQGAARKRLDDFLLYLQRYVLSKPPLPLDVDLDLQELYARLKITPPPYDSYDEACIAVAEVEAKAAAAAAAAAKAAAAASKRGGGLGAIVEEKEEGEEEEGEENMFDDDDGGSSSSGSSSSSGGGSSSSSSGESGSEDSDDDTEEVDSEEEEEEEGENDADDEDMMVRERTEAEEEFERDLAAAMGEGLSTTTGGGGGGGGIKIGTDAILGGGDLSGGGGGFVPSSSSSSSGGLKVMKGGAAPSHLHHQQQQQQPRELMSLRVMMKKGARSDRTGELLIPVSASAARQLREKEAIEATERAEMKRLVLGANRRDEMDAVAEAAALSRGRNWRGGGGGNNTSGGGRSAW